MVIFSLFGYAFGKTVNEQSARKVAANYVASNAKLSLSGEKALLQLCHAPAGNTNLISDASPAPLYYIYNINDARGFVIISGDDVVHPVLAYSSEGGFIPDNIPANVAAWLADYGDQIQHAIISGVEATQEIREEWATLSGATPPSQSPDSPQGVDPLLKTKWGQGQFYNALCPWDNMAGARTITGCVATAMAMVMKYNNWPPTGNSSHAHNTRNYGTLYGFFGITDYYWSLMPDFVTSPNSAVATLMYHCGISVNMNYGVTFSGANMIIGNTSPPIHCAEYALKTYFGYDKTSVNGLERKNYTNAAWSDLLRKELDASHPVIYGGYQMVGGGHCFVCDGYDNLGKFHFNWGWDGNYDGYYLLDYLNPNNQGAYYLHEAIIGIRKPAGATDDGKEFYKLMMNAPITCKSDTISYKDTLSFHTNIMNKDLVAFNGDICAVIFDTNYVLIDYVQVNKGVSLQPGAEFPAGISFTNPGLSSMLPGSYYVGIMYSLGDTNWKGVNDTISLLRKKRIEVVNKNDIEMYAAMNITPGTTIPQGSPVTVQLDITNRGLTNLQGILALTLYDVDGDSMKIIDEKTNFTLLSQEHTNGLIFTHPGLNELPASYQLVLRYLPDGATEWKLIGSGSYENPVDIIVVAVPLQADMYEPNNAQDAASALPVSFGTNPVVIMTEGANCHTGSDNDFYKITLTEGYSYELSCFLDDFWSNTSNDYTLEGIWSYTLDGTNWAGPFDDTIPPNIIMNNGGTILFHIVPGFTVEPGTYQFKITIVRNPLGMDETDSHDVITIYPNPASERLVIKSRDRQGYVSGYQMSNLEGREIMNATLPESVPVCTINTVQLAEGFYILRITTTYGVLSRKVIIRR